LALTRRRGNPSWEMGGGDLGRKKKSHTNKRSWKGQTWMGNLWKEESAPREQKSSRGNRSLPCRAKSDRSKQLQIHGGAWQWEGSKERTSGEEGQGGMLRDGGKYKLLCGGSLVQKKKGNPPKKLRDWKCQYWMRLRRNSFTPGNGKYKFPRKKAAFNKEHAIARGGNRRS